MSVIDSFLEPQKHPPITIASTVSREEHLGTEHEYDFKIFHVIF